MSNLSTAQHSRQKVASLSRHRPASPELEEARRDLAAAKIADYIHRTVQAAPPLTAEQRLTLAGLLMGGGAHARAS